jgi:hypothetical protein
VHDEPVPDQVFREAVSRRSVGPVIILSQYWFSLTHCGNAVEGFAMSSNRGHGSSDVSLHGKASRDASAGGLHALTDGPGDDNGGTGGSGKKKLKEVLKEKGHEAIEKGKDKLGDKLADKAENFVKSKVKGFGGELLGEAAGIIAHEAV